jgi:Rho GTPase-activating protein RGD1
VGAHEYSVRKYKLTLADSSQVDFRNPESFFHDVNSVCGLLKQFLRDLPDPLLTEEHYSEFTNAARKFER